MSRYGSASVPFFFLDSFDLCDQSLVSITGPDLDVTLERTDGFGQTHEAHTPVGLRAATMAVEGFFDDGDLGTLAAFITPGAVSRILTTGVAGNVAGQNVSILTGAFAGKVRRMPKREELTKAAADIRSSGAVLLNGVILQPLATKSATWDTQGAESVDNGASSANGGTAVLHVKAQTGFTGTVVKVRHSADDVTYADLLTFTTVTSWTPPTAPPAVAAQVATVAGTVNRHLAMSGTPTGAGSITCMVAFARG